METATLAAAVSKGVAALVGGELQAVGAVAGRLQPDDPTTAPAVRAAGAFFTGAALAHRGQLVAAGSWLDTAVAAFADVPAGAADPCGPELEVLACGYAAQVRWLRGRPDGAWAMVHAAGTAATRAGTTRAGSARSGALPTADTPTAGTAAAGTPAAATPAAATPAGAGHDGPCRALAIGALCHAWIAVLEADYATAQQQARLGVDHLAGAGDTAGTQRLRALLDVVTGRCRAAAGDPAGAAQLVAGMRAWSRSGARAWEHACCCLLAGAWLDLDRPPQAKAAARDGLAAAARVGELLFLPELHRLHGELLARDGPARRRAAVDLLRRAHELAARQGAVVWRDRAATSLTALGVDPGSAADR